MGAMLNARRAELVAIQPRSHQHCIRGTITVPKGLKDLAALQKSLA